MPSTYGRRRDGQAGSCTLCCLCVQEEAQRRLDMLAVDLRRFAVAKLQRALARIDWPTPLIDRGDALGKEVRRHF